MADQTRIARRAIFPGSPHSLVGNPHRFVVSARDRRGPCRPPCPCGLPARGRTPRRDHHRANRRQRHLLGVIDAEAADPTRRLLGLDQCHHQPCRRTPEKHQRTTLQPPSPLAKCKTAFASPETISFWSLPRFIALLTDSGFAAVKAPSALALILSIPCFCSPWFSSPQHFRSR